MKFIDSYIKNLKSEKSWYEKTETSGLGIRVMPSGSKSWIYRYTMNSKRQKMTLGKYPAVSLKQARELLLKAQELRAKRINPIEYHKQEKTREIYTVEKLFTDWYHGYIIKNRKRPLDIKKQIDADIIPLLGNRELATLQTIDITYALDQIVNRGAPILANRILSSLKQALNYAVNRGNISQNPAASIRAKDIGGIEKPCDRVLTLEEIKKIWLFLDSNTCQMSLQTKSAIKIIILTGVRTAEIRLAKWEHIDHVRSLWIIPAQNHKGAMILKIHLTTLAKSLFQTLKIQNNAEDFILPGFIANNPLEENALPRAIRRIQDKIGIPEWTAHDLRRTFATQLGETLDIDPVVIEKCLGHKMPKIMATYNKNEMLPQRKVALEQWSSLIEDLVQ